MAIQPPFGPVQNSYDPFSIARSSKEEVDQTTYFYAIGRLVHLSEGTLVSNSNDESVLRWRGLGKRSYGDINHYKENE